MKFTRNIGSFSYNALLLTPDCVLQDHEDHQLAWTFERRDGFDIVLNGDTRKWTVSWVVDGINISLDVHPGNVMGVAIGPKPESLEHTEQG